MGCVGCERCGGIPNRQLIHARGIRQPLGNLGPRHEQLIRLRRGRVFGFGLFKARLRLPDELVGLSGRVLFFNQDEGQVAIAGQIVEEGRRARFLGQRNDGSLIECFDRALSRWVVPANRLDGFADELDANRIVGAGRKIVDDAATNTELAVLIDRIFARESGVGQKIPQHNWIEIHPVLQLDRGSLEIAGGAQPG